MELLNSRLKFGSALGTVIAVACWSSWSCLSPLWIALVTLAQVLSLYAECASLSEKVMCLKYWAEDAQKTANKLTALWLEIKIDEIAEFDIWKRFQDLQDEWSALDARFLHGIDSYNRKVLELAQEEATHFMDNVLCANHKTDNKSQKEVVIYTEPQNQ